MRWRPALSARISLWWSQLVTIFTLNPNLINLVSLEHLKIMHSPHMITYKIQKWSIKRHQWCPIQANNSAQKFLMREIKRTKIFKSDWTLNSIKILGPKEGMSLALKKNWSISNRLRPSHKMCSSMTMGREWSHRKMEDLSWLKIPNTTQQKRKINRFYKIMSTQTTLQD